MAKQADAATRAAGTADAIRGLALTCALAASAGVLVTTPQAVAAGTNPQTAQAVEAYDFDIAPQPLASALNAFSTVTGWEVGYATAIAPDTQASAVSGSYTAEQALRRLLAGTGLDYAKTGANSVRLQRAQAAAPEGEAHDLGPVVVSATRTETPVSQLTRPVTVVSNEDVDKQKRIDRSLGEILSKSVPGFSPSTEALTDFGQTLRGRTFLTMIDGVPQTTPLRDGRRSLNTIDADAIERVEVVRGGTAAYGFGAAGGLVNVITRRPEPGALNLHSEAGFKVSTQHLGDSLEWHTNHRASGRTGEVDYVVSGTFVQRNSFFDADGDRIPADPFGVQGGLADTDEFNVLGKGGYEFDGGQQRLEVTINHFNIKQDSKFAGLGNGDPAAGIKTPAVRGNINAGRRHQDAGGARQHQRRRPRHGEHDHQPELSQRRIHAQPGGRTDLLQRPDDDLLQVPRLPAGRDRLGKAGRPADRGHAGRPGPGPVQRDLGRRLSAGRHRAGRHRRALEHPGHGAGRRGRLPGGRAARGRSRPAALRRAARGDQRRRRRRGEPARHLRRRRQAGVQRNAGERQRRRLRHRQRRRLRRLLPGLLAGGHRARHRRRHRHAGDGAGIRDVTDNVDVFAGFSQGFSLADIGRAIADGTATRATALESEAQKVDNYELGIRAAYDRWDASITGFFSQSENGTTFDPDLNITKQPEEIYGVEVAANARPHDMVRLGGTFTWMEGQIDLDDDGDFEEDLPSTRIPPVKVTSFVEVFPTEWAAARLQGLYSGDRNPDSSLFGGSEVNDYILFDLFASVDTGYGQFEVGVENLFNEDYFPVLNQAAALPFAFSKGPGRTVSLTYAVKW